ncbi:MAG: hypothetical protein WBL67_08820 [Nitrososphaeraceae archaeon]
MNKRFGSVGSVSTLMCCIAFAAVGILSAPNGVSEGLEVQAQDSANGNQTIDLMVDELLTDYPVLSELTQENITGQIEYLNSLNSSESVQTLLALNALGNLVELRDSQLLASQSNQTAMGNSTGVR